MGNIMTKVLRTEDVQFTGGGYKQIKMIQRNRYGRQDYCIVLDEKELCSSDSFENAMIMFELVKSNAREVFPSFVEANHKQIKREENENLPLLRKYYSSFEELGKVIGRRRTTAFKRFKKDNIFREFVFENDKGEKMPVLNAACYGFKDDEIRAIANDLVKRGIYGNELEAIINVFVLNP